MVMDVTKGTGSTTKGDGEDKVFNSVKVSYASQTVGSEFLSVHDREWE